MAGAPVAVDLWCGERFESRHQARMRVGVPDNALEMAGNNVGDPQHVTISEVGRVCPVTPWHLP